jgi:hypothetical protein
MGVKGYKAFNKGMKCRGKQYEENTTYEEKGNEICKASVMHFCEDPFDVLNYYPLIDENGDISDFAEVEATGDIYKKEDKTATNKLHIGTKLGLKGFIKACVDFTIEKTRVEPMEDDGADNNGYSAKITSEGKDSVVMAAGYNSIARAKIGSWITLAEWVKANITDEKGSYIWKPKCVKTEYVDGARIKEDTFYKLVDGKFKEVGSEE